MKENKKYNIEKSFNHCRKCGSELVWYIRKTEPIVFDDSKRKTFFSRFEMCKTCNTQYFHETYRKNIEKQQQNALFVYQPLNA